MATTRHDYHRLTFTVSLPRSRTKWLSELLSQWCITYHEVIPNFRDIEAFGRWLDLRLSSSIRPIVIADTSTILFLHRIRQRFPGARFVHIRRRADEVHESLKKVGVDGGSKQLEMLEKCISKMDAERMVGEPLFMASELSQPQAVKHLITTVITPHIDMNYVWNMVRTNVQCSADEVNRYKTMVIRDSLAEQVEVVS